MSADSSDKKTTSSAQLSDEEWKKKLTNEQYRILRRKDTEFPGTGQYTKHYEDGVYRCAGCDQELYT